MIDKRVHSVAEAVAGVRSGDTILVGGFGDVGLPNTLLYGLLDTDVRDLTLVSNNAGVGDDGIGVLLRERRVRKIVCSFPRSSGSVWFDVLFRANELELELVPQGTLTERIRAGGAGIGGFYTPTAAGTLLAAGKQTRELDGRTYVLEEPIRGDVAFVVADTADRWGNLIYRAAGRNFGPTMVAAADVAVVEVARYVELGALSPETIVTPGVYVDRVLVTGAELGIAEEG